MAVKPRVDIYIDKLVLHGFAASQRHHIADAVQAELTRLFSEKGVPAPLHTAANTPVIKAENVHMSNGTKNNTIGNSIAGSVYKSFEK